MSSRGWKAGDALRLKCQFNSLQVPRLSSHIAIQSIKISKLGNQAEQIRQQKAKHRKAKRIKT